MVALDPFLMNLVYAPALTDVETWPLNLRQEFKGEPSPRILAPPPHQPCTSRAACQQATGMVSLPALAACESAADG